MKIERRIGVDVWRVTRQEEECISICGYQVVEKVIVIGRFDNWYPTNTLNGITTQKSST
jgi:hypothetical protein